MSTTSIPQEDTIVAMSRRDELKRVQLQLDQIQKELSTLIMTPTNSIETVTKEVECISDQTPSGHWDDYDVVTFDEDSMEEMSRTTIEYDELHGKSYLFETHDIAIPLSVGEVKSEYHLWTTPQPPSFGDSFKTSH